MPNSARTTDEWETIIRQAIADYLADGGKVQRLANASGYQPIAIFQFISGERTTMTLRNAAKLANVLGLRLVAKRRRSKAAPAPEKIGNASEH